MGYTFAAALLKKTTTAPGTRKEFREAMETLGYRRAASAEEASLCLRMHQDKKSAWLSLALEMPEDLDKEMELLSKIAAEMHTPILYFMNFDSDFLYIAATDGRDVQHVHVGFIDDDDEAMEDSDDLSIFDALLPDDAARAEFRRILAVDDEERVFSEEAAQEMAALFGYTPEVLFIDEEAKPFAEFNFDLPGEEAVPFLMPEDALPVCRIGIMGLDNPSDVEIQSCGGVGKGIRILLRADGYDAHDWELPVLWLTNEHIKHVTGSPAEIPCDEKVVPKRCKFQDGGEGWLADFPDAPIYRGVNQDSPMVDSAKAWDYHGAHSSILHIAFCGGTFVSQTLEEPDADMLRDSIKMMDWYMKRQEYEQKMPNGKTHIWIVPLQNPGQSACSTVPIPRKPFRKEIPHDWLRGYWPEDELK